MAECADNYIIFVKKKLPLGERVLAWQRKVAPTPLRVEKHEQWNMMYIIRYGTESAARKVDKNQIR